MNQKMMTIGFVLALAATAHAQQEQAQQILKESGVTGGLVVHLGCGDGKLTAALRANDSFIVHGLDADPKNVEAARKHIQSFGSYGPVSAAEWSGGALPYADNLVNLVVAEKLGGVSMDEVMRVLSPNGVALIGGKKTVKPWPKEIDEWTHYLHGSDNNAVANDRLVGPPRRLQWLSDPLWGRSHELSPSVVGVVSAAGRLFYIEDEGPRGVLDTRFPERWSLVARDAFNGLLLWRRPVPPFNKGFLYWLSFANDQNRRLVASAERVFYAQGGGLPVIALDAATGQTSREFTGTESMSELMLSHGILLGASSGSLAAFDADSGRKLWERAAAGGGFNAACDVARAVYVDKQEIVGVDLKTGAVQWQQPLATVVGETTGLGKNGGGRARIGMIVLAENKVFLALAGGKTGYQIAALTAKDGRLLWRKEVKGDGLFFSTPSELFVVNGIVWASTSGIGLDIETGEVKKEVRVDITGGHHQRCHMRKATTNYLLGSKRGVEFIAQEPAIPTVQHDWVRGTCKVGVVPANGLLYAPPHACFCHPGVLLKGFKALAASGSTVKHEAAERLERGPAYGAAVSRQQATVSNTTDWPAYRNDVARSGFARTELPKQLREKWNVALLAPLTPPVAADGKVFVAEKDRHSVVALDQVDGKRLWTFTAGGRIDSPPTWHDGALYFGCRDGRVYCLRAADGVLAWSFQAAPARRLIVCREQLESVWPVSGSVIVVDGKVYCAAGHSTYLDDGIVLYALEAKSGKVMASSTLHTEQNAETQALFQSHHIELGGNADLLVWDGERLHMGMIQLNAQLELVPPKRLDDDGGAFDAPLHLATSSGFLDDSQHNRSHWTYLPAWPGMHYTTLAPRSGQLLVFDEQTTYGIKLHDFLPSQKRNVNNESSSKEYLPEGENLTRSPARQTGSGALLIADRNDSGYTLPKSGTREGGGGIARSTNPLWQVRIPTRVRAMALTKNIIIVAGPPDAFDSNDPLASFAGRGPGKLSLHSRQDGRTMQELVLDSQPVFDGIAVAHGGCYLATMDGKVQCYRGIK